MQIEARSLNGILTHEPRVEPGRWELVMLSSMGVGRPDGQSSLRQLALTHPAETLTVTKCAVESVTFDFFSFSENLIHLRWLRIDFIGTIATAEDM